MLIWDGFGLQSTHSGIGRYGLELAEGLEKLAMAPKILPSVSRLDPVFKRWEAALPAFSLGRIKPLALWKAGRQARALTFDKPGLHIFHGLSNYNIPDLPKNFRKVLTVHDLIPFLAKDAVSNSLRHYLSYQMPRAVAAADVIVCVSQWSADHVEERFPASRGKVRVIHNGRPPMLERRQGGANRKKRLFSLCRSESYKRLNLIPEILKALPEDYEWHVLTDARGAIELAQIPRLFVYKSLPDDALKDLWNRTEIFVHPSLWEGYCLPAASALSHCIPSVYTGGSGIDEVLGDAGKKMRSEDTARAWATAIEDMGNDPRRWRENCKAQWAGLPSWQGVAGQFQTLYDTLA
jgi:glycosyltransferase involved in cell wall biosynthesis